MTVIKTVIPIKVTPHIHSSQTANINDSIATIAGRWGAFERAQSLTKERRSEIASHAAKIRHQKKGNNARKKN